MDATSDLAVPAQRHARIAAALDRRCDTRHRNPDRGHPRVHGRRGRRCRPAVCVARPNGQDLVSNDEVADWIRLHANRFAGLATVDLDRPMEAVRELRRRVRDDGFVGLRVVPWLWNAPPTDRRYYPLFAECVQLEVPFCTQVGHTGPLRPSETGRPIPYIDQVALDFPELVIVCGHVGYPWTEEMVAVARKHENVYIDTSAYTTKRLPDELVRFLKTGTGQRKVLFGTNYPMITHAHALAGLDELGLDDETRSAYLHGNAERIFGLGQREAQT
ncbi:amidohydrolase family protein [Mycobacterium xenopi 4042]|uniref:Amidohydrolase family protein n=1 Tax=Mycobacterium xenopi 4042 TaxID=1299334 RepID=X7ZU04_MYCXE|nr:amidohydrolase family protein [Mycobacterium xenopi 4042]